MDSSLFTLHISTDLLWVLVYVDDILLTNNNSKMLDAFIVRLNNTFSLKDLGSLSYLLGVEVTRTDSGLHLSQQGYIIDFL